MRYVRYAPAFQAVLARTAMFVSGAAGLWALLPTVAREHANWGPTGYGLMLGSIGAGAVLGTLLLPAIRRATNADVIVAGGTILFLWGALAGPLRVPLALVASATWMVAGLAAGFRFRLPAGPLPNVDPFRYFPLAPPVPAAEYERGPVLVTVEYRVPADKAAQFRNAAGPLRSARLREGATFWDLFQDVEDGELFVEVFWVESWVEHLRQHERVTDEDWADLAAARALHTGDGPPRVRHSVEACPCRTE
jgi:hypothetical protein